MYDLSIPGYMYEAELAVISEIAKHVPENGIIVELGSYKGRSAVAWASSCHPSVKVYCVDLFAALDMSEPDFFEEFKENTKHLPNIIPIRGLAPVLIDYPEYPIDVFFNDGTHHNPYDWNNIQYFRKFVKPGGLIMGHDYDKVNWPDVVVNAHRLESELSNPLTLYTDTTFYSIRT